MAQRIFIRYAASRGSTRAVCAVCLLTILTAAFSLPLYAADATAIPDPIPADIGLSIELAASAPAVDNLPAGEPQQDGPVLVVPAVPSDSQLGSTTNPDATPSTGQSLPFLPLKTTRSGLNSLHLKLAAAGLIVIPLDNALARAVPRIPPEHSTDVLTKAVNSLGSPGFLLPLIGGMYFTGNKDDKDTAKMALSALVNAGIMTGGMKALAGRARPIVSDEGEFAGPGAGKGYASFPSGHTASAFAVATVLANRHPKQKWLYYGLATAVGLARIRKSAHFPSDVLVGAGIGVYMGNKAIKDGPRLFSFEF